MKITHALLALFAFLGGPAQAAPLKVFIGGTSLAQNWRPPGAVAKRGGEVGPQYSHLITTVKEVLANLGTEFPELAGRQVEMAGFGWHQGWQDGCDAKMAAEYEANMA